MVLLEIKRDFYRQKPQDMDNNQSCDKISNGEKNESDINRPEEVSAALLLHLFKTQDYPTIIFSTQTP